jgi:hypothetical protein
MPGEIWEDMPAWSGYGRDAVNFCPSAFPNALLLYKGTIYSACPSPYPEILPGVGEYKTFGE